MYSRGSQEMLMGESGGVKNTKVKWNQDLYGYQMSDDLSFMKSSLVPDGAFEIQFRVRRFRRCTSSVSGKKLEKFGGSSAVKMKAEALKEQTPASRPIKALMVYPPNTPVTLVPMVLLTKSQVKINIFALIQLFLEFKKTCKKRITPTGLTEGERGFEQTKECYLTEVIPFFKTLKEHFEGIKKALTKEIKEMKEIFEELEAEVDQNVMNRKCDEIERKNLLIANDNLIADCLSKDVFYIATNSELTVSRFTKMHDAHTVVQARCLELEA
ncbi:hypothetical protein Tco_0194348 [Tanacetum coccineum]